MMLQPGHAEYLMEQFEKVAIRWAGLNEKLHGYYPARYTRPLLESLAKWSDQVVRAFSIECFPSFIHKPPSSNEKASSLAGELTGADDEQQAGLRIIFWAALFESGHWAGVPLKDDQNPFRYDVSEWFDTLFDSDDDRVVAVGEPVAWIRTALELLTKKHARLAVQFDQEKKSIRVDGSDIIVSAAEFEVLKTLFRFGEGGLTKDQLTNCSGHTDARKILDRAVHKHSILQKHVIFPGTSGGGGYRWM